MGIPEYVADVLLRSEYRRDDSINVRFDSIEVVS